jgi:hypothetical protein
MTEPNERKSSVSPKPGEQLLCELQEWEAAQSSPPTLFDVVRTGNANLTAAFLARGFQAAARKAVRGSERVFELRNLAHAAIVDPDAAEVFLRSYHLELRRTPLEAAVESSDGFVDGIKALPPHVRSVALRLCDLIAGKWKLTGDERWALFDCTPDEFGSWTAEPSATPDELVERVSLLLAINKALATLLPSDSHAFSWVKKPNSAPIFGGLTALDIMIRDGVSGIRLVRDYLEAEIWSV